ncbi:MAG: hypothetical protein JWN15_3461 [Firmicutes bacterium]|nr:hypothetical protein [Bacillota bacterium]
MRRWIFIAVVVAVAIIIAIALLIWLLPLWLLITLAILLALFLLFLPIQIAVQTRQHGLEATMWVQLKLPLLKFSKAINITDKVRQALQKALKQWRKRRRKKGHAASASPSAQRSQPKRPPPPPLRPVMHAVRQPMRYFARHIRFSQCRLRAEIGGFDAMQSALLAGALWSVVGMVLGVAGTLIRMEPGVPKIAIVPNFSGPTWRLQADCIVHFRLGHAIVAGVWALVRLLRENELVRWWQQGRRRKGVEGSG